MQIKYLPLWPAVTSENSTTVKKTPNIINLLNPTGSHDAPTDLSSTAVRSAHTVFVCFLFLWEQTATCATYSINWLVFITEMKNVYSTVGTGALNKAVCTSSLKPTSHMMHQQFNIQQLYLYSHCICVFCIYLRTNSYLCHLQHKLIGFYSRDEKCYTARYGLGL